MRWPGHSARLAIIVPVTLGVISAAVGFIALFGVATLNGVVLLSSARRLEDQGLSSLDAARRAAHERPRLALAAGAQQPQLEPRAG